VFTFAEEARTSYERMIELVDRAERFLAERAPLVTPADAGPAGDDPAWLVDLARIRRAVSDARGSAQLAVLDASADARAYAARDDVASIATRGPITPDHVIRTKRVPVVVDAAPADGVPEVAAFAADYAADFERLRTPGLTMLDPAPRAAVWRTRGTIAFGTTPKECRIIDDIARHTRRAVQTAERLGGWAALPAEDIFELEYWSLEQAKLARGGGAAARPHAGRVALVTGAASGIGAAACCALRADGAAVVGIDLDPAVAAALDAPDAIGIAGDVTDAAVVRGAVERAVRTFGGLDIVVANAGIFRTGEPIEAMDDDTWDATLAVNLSSVRRLLAASIPYLRHGVEPSVLMVGSRNVRAPGPGAAAYSVSKAGLTQLARVAALELAGDGVRVNVVHPDAVFDTGVWTEDALARSAARYGMSVEAYKQRNLLGATITAADVGRLLSTLAGPAFGATTGAQIPIDGGNDRVI
jgi:NAD(P)-dependent dehydrogenase (short-subunit alcohol dehydrogenase family)